MREASTPSTMTASKSSTMAGGGRGCCWQGLGVKSHLWYAGGSPLGLPRAPYGDAYEY